MITPFIKSGHLEIHIHKEDNSTIHYEFSGVVDETFSPDLVPRCLSTRVTFELSKIKGFNSCGIREWVVFVKRFSQTHTLIFKSCSVAMIDQINMIPMMLGNAKIHSFYAPYYCSSCEHNETERLIQSLDYRESIENGTAPAFYCDHCNNMLEFDAIPSAYFKFAEKKALSQSA